MTEPQTTTARNSKHAGGRRFSRGVLSVVIGFPFAIVTVPLAVWLVAHFVLKLPGLYELCRSGEMGGIVSHLPSVMAIVSFFVLVFVYLFASFYKGWK